MMKGWREGMEKVSLTKLQVELLKLSLKESKSNVDSLLDNDIVIIEIKDAIVAKEFFKKAEDIGVICEIRWDS